MEWPLVSIAVLTFNRPEEIRRTIAALEKYVDYEGPVQWWIGDDGSPEPYLTNLQEEFKHLNIKTTNTQRKGWGINANTLHDACFEESDYVFFIEDDYVALDRVNLTEGVAVLQSDPSLGIIRYDGITRHIGLELTLKATQTEIGEVGYLEINKDSGHLNVYSNRPHMITKRAFRSYGYYKKRAKLGRTEEEYAMRVKENKNAPAMIILEDGISLRFDHIGVSYQLTEYDIGK